MVWPSYMRRESCTGTSSWKTSWYETRIRDIYYYDCSLLKVVGTCKPERSKRTLKPMLSICKGLPLNMMLNMISVLARHLMSQAS